MASKAAEKCEGYWSLGKQDAEMDPLGWVSTSRKVTWYRDHFCRRGKMKAEVKGRMFSKEGKKKISNGFQPDTTSFLKVKTISLCAFHQILLPQLITDMESLHQIPKAFNLAYSISSLFFKK